MEKKIRVSPKLKLTGKARAERSHDLWRVQAKLRGVITHDSTFTTCPDARFYFDALEVPGITELQVRPAGKRAFITVKSR